MTEFDVTTYPLQVGKNGLIVAGAGCGKTTALENLVIRLLLEGIKLPDGSRREIALREMLVVTFTEAATAELILRVRDKISAVYRQLRRSLDTETLSLELPEFVATIIKQGGPVTPQRLHRLNRQLRLALLSFDEATIATIHGFCYRMLNEFAFESGVRFDLELIGDDSELLQEVAEDFWRANFYGKNNRFAAIAAAAVKLDPEALRQIFRLTRKYPYFDYKHEVSLSIATERLEDACSRLLDYWVERDIANLLNATCNNFTRKSQLTSDRYAGLHSDNEPGERCAAALGIAAILTLLPENIRKKPKTPWPGEVTFDDNGTTPCFISELAEIADDIVAEMRTFRVAVQMEFIAKANAEKMLENKKQIQGVQSFDDLLRDMHDAVTVSPEFAEKIRRRFPVALIDEFQDTDPVQFAIFQKIFHHAESLMIMVGDPKQSIYAFRGADIYSYLQVANELPENNKSTLSRNYRSSPRLIEAVNQVFDRDNPFVNEHIQFIPAVSGKIPDKLVIIGGNVEQKPFKIWELKNDENKAMNKDVASTMARNATSLKIAEILALARQRDEAELPLARFESSADESWRPVRANDIAVLTDTKKEAMEMCRSLTRLKVPAAVQHAGNVFESEEAVNLYLALSAIASPGNMRLVKTALATPLFQFTLQDILRLEDENEAAPWQELFSRLLQVWHEHGFIQMFFRLLRSERTPLRSELSVPRKDIRCNLLSLPDGERRLTDLLHLGELIHREARRCRLGVTAVLALLRQRIQQPEEHEEYERRLETDEDAVKIMTVHKSKGLQFGLVFCPFMWNRSLENRHKKDETFFYHQPVSSGYQLRFHSGTTSSLEALRQYHREELGELIRLVYVALTRAINYCCMTWPNINNIEKTAPGYLAGNFADNELDKLLNGGKVDVRLGNFYRWLQSPFIEYGCPSMEPVQYRLDDTPPEIVLPKFDRVFPASWHIMSFSALTAHSETDHHSEFELDDEPETLNEIIIPEINDDDVPALSADFPGGTVTGNCIHHIFERLDFRMVKHLGWQQDKSIRETIGNTLEAFGRIDDVPDSPTYPAIRNRRIDQICAMLDKVLNTPLPNEHGKSCFCLADVAPESTVAEMEFFFPVPQHLDYQRLNRVIEEFGQLRGNIDPTNDEDMLRGMMTGKIDLLLKWQQQFYILDWKTNLLGNTGSCYATSEIEHSMASSNYLLQAAIYTLALDKYLSQRLPNYQFSEHFGGVYYLYVRGMNGISPNRGIWHKHPSPETLQLLQNTIG